MKTLAETQPGPMPRATPAQLRDYAALCQVRAYELDKATRKNEAETFREMEKIFRDLEVEVRKNQRKL